MAVCLRVAASSSSAPPAAVPRSSSSGASSRAPSSPTACHTPRSGAMSGCRAGRSVESPAARLDTSRSSRPASSWRRWAWTCRFVGTRLANHFETRATWPCSAGCAGGCTRRSGGARRSHCQPLVTSVLGTHASMARAGRSVWKPSFGCEMHKQSRGASLSSSATRGSAPQSFLVADTHHNRAVLRELGPTFAAMFPMGGRMALASLRAGVDPGASALVVL